MITPIGELTIGEAIPGAAAAALAGAAGINAALPDILGRIAALQAFAPSPIDFQAQLQLANDIVSSITLAISAGLSPPSMAAQIAMVSALIADLLASVTAINANLEIVTSFLALMSAPGVHAYAYAGTVSAFGAEFAAEFAGGLPGGLPGDHADSIVLITSVPATWDAMSEIFKVSP